MNISLEQVLMVVGGASTVTTAIFWGAFLLGRLHSRMEAVEVGIEGLGHRLDRAGEKMSDISDIVQKFPGNYLSRAEAMHWKGSRATDPHED
jgi:hypothetical protein